MRRNPYRSLGRFFKLRRHEISKAERLMIAAVCILVIAAGIYGIMGGTYGGHGMRPPAEPGSLSSTVVGIMTTCIGIWLFYARVLKH